MPIGVWIVITARLPLIWLEKVDKTLYPGGWWPRRNGSFSMLWLGEGLYLSPAIEWNKCFFRCFSLADRALRELPRREGGRLGIDPFVHTWPAVEMAAKGDYWIARKLKAYVAIEARRGFLRGNRLPFLHKVLLEFHPDFATTPPEVLALLVNQYNRMARKRSEAKQSKGKRKGTDARYWSIWTRNESILGKVGIGARC